MQHTTNTCHSPRVAVIGARGIGKQHAKWFQLEGCEVVAFAGTNAEQLPKTAEALKNLLPFVGHGYAEVTEMLQAERPDLVVIASPHALHLTHLRLALEHGAHIYMEKPFVWTQPGEMPLLLEKGRSLLRAAQEAGRLVAINTQYVCAWDSYERFTGAGVANASSLFVEMESKNLGRDRHFESIWVDLGSHPISMLLRLVPAGRIAEEGTCVSIRQNETVARFLFADDSGREVRADFRCGSIDHGTPRRRFGVEETLVDCGGRNDAAGIFRAVLSRAGPGPRAPAEAECTDFMHESIHRFVQAVRSGDAELIAATGVEGLRNLEIHLQLTNLATRDS